MTVVDKKVDKDAAVGREVISLFLGDFAQGQADLEAASVRIPHDAYIVEAHAWARGIGATQQTVELEDDGTDIAASATEIGTAGAQTAISGVADHKLAAGSELQVKVDTSGASESFTALVVTVVIRPQYMKGDPPKIL